MDECDPVGIVLLPEFGNALESLEESGEIFEFSCGLGLL